MSLAKDGLLVVVFDSKINRLRIQVDHAKYKRFVRVGFEAALAVPGDCSVSAENATIRSSYDCLRGGLVVALGMEARCFETISARSIDQLATVFISDAEHLE